MADAPVAAFRHMTMCHVADGEQWCLYLMNNFLQTNSYIRVISLNLSQLAPCQPPELEFAIRESHALFLLVTDGLLTYMEDHKQWLPAMLQKRDSQLTSVVASALYVDHEDILAACEDWGYDGTGWVHQEIHPEGENITDLLGNVIDLVEKNSETLKRRNKLVPPKRREQRTKCSLCEMVPGTIHMARNEEVALMFRQEHKGKIKIEIAAKPVSFTVVNPYSVVFRTPELKEGYHTVRVSMAGKQKKDLQLCKKGFTSLELLMETYKVETIEELDRVLARQFRDSVCDDVSQVHMKGIPTGSSPYDVESKYSTIMHWAAANGLPELCAVIIHSPGGIACCSLANEDGVSPADLAKSNGHDDVYDFIMGVLEMDKCFDNVESYIQFCSDACQEGFEECIYVDPDYNDQTVYELFTDSPPKQKSGDYFTCTGSPRPQPEEDDIYEKFDGGELGPQDDYETFFVSDPKPPPRIPPPTPPKPKNLLQARAPERWLPSPQELFGEMLPLNQAAMGSRSQSELLDILDQYKQGTFNMDDAEMLFRAWKSRYGTGQGQSFKAKMKDLNEFRTMRNACQKDKEKNTIPEEGGATFDISEPFQSRQSNPRSLATSQGSSGNSWGSSQGSLSIASSISTASSMSYDSGRSSASSGRESNLSSISNASSVATEEECSNVVPPVRRLTSTSRTEKAAEPKRKSMRDSFLEKLPPKDLDRPPALPPRPKNVNRVSHKC